MFMANSLLHAVTANIAQLSPTAADTPANASSLFAVTDGDTASDAEIAAENAGAAAAEHEMLSQIIQGYSQDPWFQSASNTALLEL